MCWTCEGVAISVVAPTFSRGTSVTPPVEIAPLPTYVPALPSSYLQHMYISECRRGTVNTTTHLHYKLSASKEESLADLKWRF